MPRIVIHTVATPWVEKKHPCPSIKSDMPELLKGFVDATI